MYFALSSISPHNNSSNIMRELIQVSQNFRKSQEKAFFAASVVFDALSFMTESYETGISLTSLQALDDTLEKENLKEMAVYKLVGNLIDKFDDISSDDEFITREDFFSAVSNGAMQEFFEQPEFKKLQKMLSEIRSDFCSAVSSLYGSVSDISSLLITMLENVKSDIVNDLYNTASANNDSELLDETVDYSLSKAIPSVWKSKRYATSPIQDYRTVTKEQLKSPINLSI